MKKNKQTEFCMKRKCNECNRYDECFGYKPKQKNKRKEKKRTQEAEEYIKRCKEKGLKYWSARDYLKNHKTMHSII